MVLKKYQVPGTVPSGKPPKSEPYRAVPCSGKAPLQCDNGPGFVANVVKKMCEKLDITIKYGSVYHSQSQGRVERMNQTLKGKLSKICAQTGLNWVTALPIALMATRGSTNRGTKLTPHKMVTGRTIPRGDRETIEIEDVDKLKSELDKCDNSNQNSCKYFSD